jgi:hypothetical protein
MLRKTNIGGPVVIRPPQTEISDLSLPLLIDLAPHSKILQLGSDVRFATCMGVIELVNQGV